MVYEVSESASSHVDVQNAPVCACGDACVFQTCGRFESTHGCVLNVRTVHTPHTYAQHTHKTTRYTLPHTPQHPSSRSSHTHINMYSSTHHPIQSTHTDTLNTQTPSTHTHTYHHHQRPQDRHINKQVPTHNYFYHYQIASLGNFGPKNRVFIPSGNYFGSVSGLHGKTNKHPTTH